MAKSSLRGFNKDVDKNEVKEKAKEMFGKNLDENSVDSIDDAKDILKRYEGKSEDELVTELKDMVLKGREDGSFSNEMLKQFYQNAAPMMDEEQRKKLDSLVEMISNT